MSNLFMQLEAAEKQTLQKLYNAALKKHLLIRSRIQYDFTT